MVTWNVPFERELIEQSSLFDLPMPHHDSQSCLSQRLNQGTSCVATEDFFNKIGHLRTSRLRFSHRQWFRHFAGMLDEQVCGRAERAVPQRDDAEWHAGNR